MLPTNLHTWAAQYQIAPEAFNALLRLFRVVAPEPPQHPGESEAAIQNRVRLEASRKGKRLLRNNVGAYQDEYENWIRYGLANDSHQMNAEIKSSDLIGIAPIKITPAHVGRVIGQFVARETKRGDWQYAGTPRERAQLNFLQLIASLGGDACFATGEGTM